MLEAVIRALIAICFVALAVFLVLWVLAELGLGLPPMVVKILWVVAVLLVLLYLVRLFRPHWGGWFP